MPTEHYTIKGIGSLTTSISVNGNTRVDGDLDGSFYFSNQRHTYAMISQVDYTQSALYVWDQTADEWVAVAFFPTSDFIKMSDLHKSKGRIFRPHAPKVR